MNIHFASPVRQLFPSVALSADDDPGRPTRDLIELALDAGRYALDCDLRDLSSRIRSACSFPDVWPGEHYKLLTAFVAILKPRVIIEIGTATGLSALALKKSLPADGVIVTFDLIPWAAVDGHVLRDSDFQDGRLIQVVEDLTDAKIAEKHRALLQAADFLFIDAAKDGRVEPALWNNLQQIGLKNGAWLVFDDIRMLTMVSLWRDISMPKLDITSLGHWSGTGLVRWQRRL